MKRDLLLEVGCENLPSGYIDGAIAQLEESFRAGLEELRIEYASLDVTGTPNRLVVHVREMADRQKASVETISGPPVSVAIDGDGGFTRAAEGFARREGVTPEKLQRIKTERGEYLAVVRRIRGQSTRSVLVDHLPGWISGTRFPKTMRWEKSGFRFARPVRWVLALYGGKPLGFELGPVRSSGSTRLSPYFEQETGVESIEGYYRTLRSARIILDQRERKKRVEAMARKAAIRAGGSLVEDDELCGMVANLVESPVVMSGVFDERFLVLPREVIVTALKSHQRYFSVDDGAGRLMPAFIAFADGARKNRKEIVRGYERVLQARLADAAFYFQEDTSRSIAEMAEKLRDIVWLEGLGTLLQKSERIASLASYIITDAGLEGERLGADVERAAKLIKADIASEMVKDGKEFTLLQGYIGREYSRVSGERDSVSEAIYEHYFPRFSGDRLPEGMPGTVLSLADRIDTVTGCFMQDLGPTGSQDPYALRRQAIAVLRILVEKRVELDLRSALEESLDLFRKEGISGTVTDGVSLKAAAMDLFTQRFINILRGEGFDHDLITAVLSSPWNVPFAVRDMAAALQRMRSEGRLAGFVLAMKRISNIIPGKDEEELSREERLSVLRSLGSGDTGQLGFSDALFVEEAEKAFHARVRETARRLAALDLPGATTDSLPVLEDLVPDVDLYFDEVLVNCEDRSVRENRLGFLKCLRTAFGLFCDWSRIAGEQ